MSRNKPSKVKATKPIITEEFGPDELACYNDVKHVLGNHITHNRLTPEQAENVIMAALHNIRLDTERRDNPEAP